MVLQERTRKSILYSLWTFLITIFFVVELCSNPTGCQCPHFPGDELYPSGLGDEGEIKAHPSSTLFQPVPVREFLQLILPTSITNNDGNQVLT